MMKSTVLIKVADLSPGRIDLVGPLIQFDPKDTSNDIDEARKVEMKSI